MPRNRWAERFNTVGVELKERVRIVPTIEEEVLSNPDRFRHLTYALLAALCYASQRWWFNL